MSTTDPKFDAIRPYHDDDVPKAITQLLSDSAFLNLLCRRQLPWLPRRLQGLGKLCVRGYLSWRWRNIRTVRDVQLRIKKDLTQLLASTTSKVTFSGLEHLRQDEQYVFISNHRDIALDPALVNLAQEKCGRDTVRIAIGDNLLQVPYITTLMKLNKSFVVNRSAKAPKELLKNLSVLSQYIWLSLQEGQSVWIAQREGRTKDGVDTTDPALIKMLSLAGRAQKSDFQTHMKSLKLVPVAISYQYEPCVKQKAQQLYDVATLGHYQKQAGEDIQSIIEGFIGQKGHVHVAFGQPIDEPEASPNELASSIDSKIRSLFYIHPEHLAAADMGSQQVKAEFEQYLAGFHVHLRPYVKQIYAAPVSHSIDAEHCDYAKKQAVG